MRRAARRRGPAGGGGRGEARGRGLALGGVGVVMLWLAGGWVAAGLLAFTIFFYVVVFTMWLKRRTPPNICSGGAAGGEREPARAARDERGAGHRLTPGGA